jgi:hypothetical protein
MARDIITDETVFFELGMVIANVIRRRRRRQENRLINRFYT